MNLNLKDINTNNINYYCELILKEKPSKIKLNNELTVNYKRLLINLYIIAILNEFEIPYNTEFFILDDFSTSILYKHLTNIYEYLIEKYNDYKIYYDFRWYIWYCINFINNFAIEYCSEYQYSLDIENIVKTINHPEIKEILNTKINKQYSVSNIEKQIDHVRDKLMDALGKLNIPENQFREIINLNLINKGQLGHTIYIVGFRSSIDDKTIPKVILGNYLDGLSEDIDFIEESLADKKSKIYNKLLMPLTQYANRKQQLASFTIQNIYQGDCGTTETVEYYITPNKAKPALGKYIVDKNRLVLLTNDNINKYIDKVVHMRSPLKCLYKNGTCEICGGKLVKFYMNRYFNVNHVAALIFNSTTSQDVLSNKHHQTTTSKEYKIPNELINILEKKGRNIFIKSKFKNKNIKLGFDIKDARKLLNISNLSYTIEEDDIYEYNFGIYKTLIIKENNKEITSTIPLQYYNIFPRLSKDFIIYLLHNPNVIECSDNHKLYIDISNYKKRNIFNVAVINFSVKSFYDHLDHFTQKEIGKFDNIDMALNEFTNIIYERSKVNLIYPELILKSYIIENKIDFRVSNTENKNIINFGYIKDINKFRSLGTALAFQEHLSVIRDPITYLVPKALNPMDVFLNLNI